jgi:circadian clock protein KaiC
LLTRDIEISGERNRGLYVLKSRGMHHSNQIREFILSAEGIKLIDVYLGPAGMLTGSARVALEAQERDASLQRANESELKFTQLERRRKAMEAQIEALRAEFAADEAEVKRSISIENKREDKLTENRTSIARSRKVNGRSSQANGRSPQTPERE